MKIVIAGGKSEADFLAGLLLLGKHKLTIINDDKEYCKTLAGAHDVSVYYGDPCKEYVLEEAGVRGYDVMIALGESDQDNLAVCQMAKRLFAVKKTVCTVSNPKNVEVFEFFGIDKAISAAYMLARFIEQASVIEDIVKVLPLDNQKVLMNEIVVDAAYPVIHKKIMDISLPNDTIISCIIRDTEVIIPNGQTKIMAGDKLLVLTTPQNQQRVISGIVGSVK